MTLPREQIAFTYADPALWITKNKAGQVYSSADEYKEYGVPLTKADNDRLSGKRKVDSALSDIGDGEPGMQIFDTCTHVIEQLSTLARDERNPEDVDTRALAIFLPSSDPISRLSINFLNSGMIAQHRNHADIASYWRCTLLPYRDW